jgi:hypothetical protein
MCKAAVRLRNIQAWRSPARRTRYHPRNPSTTMVSMVDLSCQTYYAAPAGPSRCCSNPLGLGSSGLIPKATIALVGSPVLALNRDRPFNVRIEPLVCPGISAH